MRTYLRARVRLQRRTLLATAFAVALAVAFLVATSAATATLRGYVGDGAAPRARVADVVAVPDLGADDVRLATADDLAAVAEVDGVSAVSVRRTATLQVRWPDGTLSTSVQPASPAADLAWYRVVDGSPPDGRGEVLVDDRTAADLGLDVGDSLEVGRVAGTRQPATLDVAGIAQWSGGAPDGRVLLAQDADLASWDPAGPPSVDEVDVALRPGADVDAAVAGIRSALGGHDVTTGREAVSRQVDEAVAGTDVLGRLALSFALVAAVVAVVVVSNTFGIVLSRRVHELAVLRCLGATRRQLVRTCLVEAGVVGAVAAAVGAAAGLALVLVGVLVTPLVAATGPVRPVVDPLPVALAILLGTAAAVAAAVRPARRAARVAPVAAMREASLGSPARAPGRVRAVVGALLVLAAGGLAGLAATGGTADPLTVGGAAVAGLLAVVVGLPVVVSLVDRVGRALLRRASPVLRLAVGNLGRDPRRAAATATAVLVGVGLISALSVAGATTVRSVDDGSDRLAPVDVALSSGATDDAPEGAFDPSTVQAVAQVRGMASAVGLRGASVTVVPVERDGSARGGDDVGLLGASPSQVRSVVRGEPALDDGTVLVPRGEGRFVDDTWPADGGRTALVRGDRRVEVTVRTVPGLIDPVVSDRTLDELGAGPALVALWGRTDADADPVLVQGRVEQAVASTRAGSAPGAGVDVSYVDQGSLSLRAGMRSLAGTLQLLATGLLAVSVVIALAGLANALALSVAERGREIAVSRSVGMTRRQVQGVVTVEAACLAVVGAVLGGLVGVLLGWAGAAALLSGSVPVGPPVLPVVLLLGVLVAVVAAAVLAALVPARRAARVAPAQAFA